MRELKIEIVENLDLERKLAYIARAIVQIWLGVRFSAYEHEDGWIQSRYRPPNTAEPVQDAA